MLCCLVTAWFAHLDAGWERSIVKRRPNYSPPTAFQLVSCVCATGQAAIRVKTRKRDCRRLAVSCYLPVHRSVAAIKGVISLTYVASPRAYCTSKSSAYSAKLLQDKLLGLLLILLPKYQQSNLTCSCYCILCSLNCWQRLSRWAITP